MTETRKERKDRNEEQRILLRIAKSISKRHKPSDKRKWFFFQFLWPFAKWKLPIVRSFSSKCRVCGLIPCGKRWPDLKCCLVRGDLPKWRVCGLVVTPKRWPDYSRSSLLPVYGVDLSHFQSARTTLARRFRQYRACECFGLRNMEKATRNDKYTIVRGVTIISYSKGIFVCG